VSVVDGGR